MSVVVITGAGAGVGRATVREFARLGYAVGLVGRDPERLEAAASEVRNLGAKAFVAQADVADAAGVDEAARAIEEALGPIDVWVNNAMVTIFAPFSEIEPDEFRRGTEVTYLGTVHGTMAALKRMRLRDRGVVINVGSALAYRSVPLQSVYCGAKSAIRGFTDALRSELMHEASRIRLVTVHLPAVNTPQFEWALNRTGHRPRPVAPIYQPEVAARAIAFAALHPRREIWVGFPTVVAILANRIAPTLADWYLARAGYSGQLTAEPAAAEPPSNLRDPIPGPYAAHGRFDQGARDSSWEMVTSRHKDTLVTAAAIVGLLAVRRLLRRRR